MAPGRLFCVEIRRYRRSFGAYKGSYLTKTSCTLTSVWVRIPADRTVLVCYVTSGTESHRKVSKPKERTS